MDIFSHGLWSGAVCKAVNLKFIKNKKPLSVKWSVLWGVFPDLIAFTGLFIWMFWNLISGDWNFSDIPHPEDAEPAQRDTFFIFRLTNILYSFSHSLAIFLIVFGFLYVIFKRPIWEMGAWLLHILVDIPTHSYAFYPTPFLWPFSSLRFDGFSWGTPWFLFVDYFLVASVYLYLFLRKRKSANEIVTFDNILLALLVLVLGAHYLGIISDGLDKTILVAVSAVATLPVIGSAYVSLKNKKISVDLLASVALVFSLIAGEYASAVFINLMLTSARIFSEYSNNRARRAIESLFKLKPKKAKVKVDGRFMEVAVEDIKRGDLVTVGLGDLVPADGIIVEGEASMDQSSLTGESAPVAKSVGDEVLSSTIVVSGNLVVRVEKIGKETTLEKIIALVEKSQSNKARINMVADRFAGWYILLSFIGATILYFVSGSLPLVLSVLLVVCADDIAVAIPLAFLMAIGYAAKRGVIIKGYDFLEGMSKLKVVVVDKTGTLTKGNLKVVDVFSFNGKSQEEVLAVGAVAFNISSHPISKSVIKYVESKKISINRPDSAEEHSGRGAHALYQGKHIAIGNRPFLEKLKFRITEEQLHAIKQEEDRGLNITLVGHDNDLIGFVALESELRPEAKDSIAELKKMGIEKVVMLTGDNEKVAKRVAEAVGIDEFYANLLPEDKLEHLKRYLGKGHKTAMIGDGVNDAAVLGLADIGIAMGAIGSDVAIESADIVLMKDDFSRIPEMIRLSKYVLGVSRQNFIVWGIVNVIGLFLVFGGVFGPTRAAAYNFLTDFIPLANSSRLLKLHLGSKIK